VKIHTSPRVHVFSSQMFHSDPEGEIPLDGDEATRIGSYCAKTAYRSFGEKGRSNVDNQKNIITSLHGRVLEHIVFGLKLSGISRALGNELITHKHITVTQESTRYCDMEDAALVLEPWMSRIYEEYPDHCDLTSQGRALASWGPAIEPRTLRQIGIVAEVIRCARNDFAAYGRLVRELLEEAALDDTENKTQTDLRKWARGKARNVLPLGTSTAMVCTGNMRAWRNFIEMRTESHAEEEIRRLASCIADALLKWAPVHLFDYVVNEVNGWPQWSTNYRKV
jgi:thymidylate synthase (FAD)